MARDDLTGAPPEDTATDASYGEGDATVDRDPYWVYEIVGGKPNPNWWKREVA